MIMLCQNCNKNEATTHVRQTINGETREAYLCPECARQAMGQDFFDGSGWEFPDLFHSLFSFPAHTGHALTGERCPVCGSSFEDIVRSGLAGCAQCYELFYDRILPSVERVHGRASHVGRIPEQAKREPTREQKIASLEEQLTSAVREQEFEQAAKLRDEIKALREQA